MRPDIIGLDLLLDGGLHLVRKLGDERESTVVLIRGAAGTGKTIMASHLGIAEAARRGGDVVYACIELLPTELAAQLAGITFGPEKERHSIYVKHAGTRSEVHADSTSHPAVFATVVDVPSVGEPDLGTELTDALDSARSIGLKPTVLVIDSLSEGYRLGGSASRSLADAFSKFAAEQGIILILVEEAAESRDSLWSFVADVIFELQHRGATGTAAGERRSLRVLKSRFGPSHVGPHGFTIRSEGGVEIYPRLSNYTSAWARKHLPRNVPERRAHWSIFSADGQDLHWPREGQVALVTGNEPIAVSRLAKSAAGETPVLTVDMSKAGNSEKANVLNCGNPILSTEFFASIFCRRLDALKGTISGVVVGDLDSIRNHLDPPGMRRALPVLISIAHHAGLSVLLYETSSADVQPASIHMADVVLEQMRMPPGAVIARSRVDSFATMSVLVR